MPVKHIAVAGVHTILTGSSRIAPAASCRPTRLVRGLLASLMAKLFRSYCKGFDTVAVCKGCTGSLGVSASALADGLLTGVNGVPGLLGWTGAV